MAFHVERLIAKEQDLMLHQRLVQLLDLAVAERLGERQAVDLGANARRDRRDVLVNKGRGSASFISGSTAEANQPTKHMYPIMDKLHFDRADYSVVVKNRAPPPNSWRWEIYRAGRSSPIERHR